ncbi:MAG: glycosyltransferase family 2 protein [Bacteroides sp.]|nr:glycosyltransferase family 2 protein [Bacteroides sp.]
MPAISVIIPVFNAEKYLEPTLESVRRQTMEDFEVLMVDDGSTDSSVAIMERFRDADPRFKLLARPNGGQSAARNTGLEAARGEWIYFIDADDTMHPDALSLLLESARSVGVKFVIGGYFEGEREIWPDEVPRRGNLKLLDARGLLRTTLYQHQRLNNIWGALIHSSIFSPGKDGKPLRFAEGLYYEDLLLFPQLCLRAERIAYLPSKLYFYRQHPGSFIHTFSPRRLDSLRVTEEILSLVEREMPELKGAARDRQMSAAFNVLMLLWRNNPGGTLPQRYHRFGKSYEEVREYCLRIIRHQRLRSLTDPGVRLKNRLGALLSFGGIPLLRFMARKFPD